MAAWGGVGDVNFIGKGGNEFVAALGSFGRGAVGACREGREQKQAALGERGFPVCRDAVAVETASGADDDGGFAAQKDGQALFFNRGVKAADDGAVGVAELGGQVEGAENRAAGALVGAE